MSLRGGYEQQDGCLLFSFTGQLDAYSDKQFLAFIADHRPAKAQPLVIDLSRIDFIDSSGLGVLVQLAKGFTDVGEFATAALHNTGVSFCTRRHFGRPQSDEQRNYIRFAFSGINVEDIEDGLGRFGAWIAG